MADLYGFSAGICGIIRAVELNGLSAKADYLCKCFGGLGEGAEVSVASTGPSDVHLSIEY